MKLVILERDGTLNALAEGEEFVASPDDWHALPGALEAVARINRQGWHAVVATNQPGLGRGLFDVAALNAIHAKMHRLLSAAGGRIDAVFYCPHAPDEHCLCRKPAPGLLEQICDRYGVAAADVQVVGSGAAHLQAGAAIGAQLHWLRSLALPQPLPGTPLPGGLPPQTQVHQDLSAFADYLGRDEAQASEQAVLVAS